MSAPTPFGLRPVFDPTKDQSRPEIYARRRLISQADPWTYSVGDWVFDAVSGAYAPPVPVASCETSEPYGHRRGASGVIVSIEGVTSIPATKTRDYYCWVLELGRRRFWCLANSVEGPTVIGAGAYFSRPRRPVDVQSDVSSGVLQIGGAYDALKVVGLASRTEFPGNDFASIAVWEVVQQFPNNNTERFL